MYYNKKYNVQICIPITSKQPLNTTIAVLREIERKERPELEQSKHNTPEEKTMTAITPVGHTRPVDRVPSGTPTTLVPFALWAKETRLSAKLTQKDLATLLEIPQSHVSQFETARTKPLPEVVEKYRTLFGIPEYVVIPKNSVKQLSMARNRAAIGPVPVVPTVVVSPEPEVVPEADVPEELPTTPQVAHHERTPHGQTSSPILRDVYIQEAVETLSNPVLSQHDVKLLVALLRSNAGTILGF